MQRIATPYDYLIQDLDEHVKNLCKNRNVNKELEKCLECAGKKKGIRVKAAKRLKNEQRSRAIKDRPGGRGLSSSTWMKKNL